jgi:hypothetical protein
LHTNTHTNTTQTNKQTNKQTSTHECVTTNNFYQENKQTKSKEPTPLLTSYGCKPSVATCPVRYLATHSNLLRGGITNDVNCTRDIIPHPCISGHILFRLSRATALLTFTREEHGSNLDRDTDYPQVFRGLHQSLSANTFKCVTIPSFLSLSNGLFFISTERAAIYR